MREVQSGQSQRSDKEQKGPHALRVLAESVLVADVIGQETRGREEKIRRHYVENEYPRANRSLAQLP